MCVCMRSHLSDTRGNGGQAVVAASVGRQQHIL